MSFNHQIWDSERLLYIESILNFVKELVTDTKYGTLNAKRLSKLGLVRWITLLVVKTTQFLPRTSSEYENILQCPRTVDDLANSYDLECTEFLTKVTDVFLKK